MINPISSVEAMQYLIAELSVRNNIDIQEIVQELNATNWHDWLKEARERVWPIIACERCYHNFTLNEDEMKARHLKVMYCNACWDKYIIRMPYRCARCKQSFPHCDLISVNLPGLDYHPAKLCSDCAEKYPEECKVECILCGSRYIPFKSKLLCDSCNIPKNTRELVRVIEHNQRAQELHLPATLTLRQWLDNLNYFDWRCAYCQGIFDAIEHYMPLSLEGSTSMDNCVPTCKLCNIRKRDKHPDVFTRLFPTENIARIRGYLERVSSLALR